MGATASMMAIAFLREQLVEVENERKKLDAEAQAINLLLEKHAGARQRSPIAFQVTQSASHANGQLSISKLVQKALEEAGKPQTSAQLKAFIASHGRTVKGPTLRSTIHQNRKLFKSVEPGTYGLVEWAK